MTVVRFTPEHVRALDRALMTMEAERAAAAKWRVVVPDLEESIETLEDLRDRMLAEQAQLAGVVSRPFDIKEWVADNLPHLRSVS